MIFFYTFRKNDGGGNMLTAIDSYNRIKVSKESSQDLLHGDNKLESVLRKINYTNWHISLWNGL
jgi:hypothetical protein